MWGMGIAKPYLKKAVLSPPKNKSQALSGGFQNMAKAPGSQPQHCGGPSFSTPQLGWHGAKCSAFVEGLEDEGK
jgi:hypothetical protein